MNIDKNFLEIEIKKQIDIIYSQIDFKENKINIHINSNRDPVDYVRSIFILYSLSRAVNYGFLNNEDKQKLLDIFHKIYSLSKDKLDYANFRAVDLYGMRFLNNLNMDYAILIKNFQQNDFSSIFSHPVSNYIFASTFFDCKEIEKIFPFSRSLINDSIATFDYIMFSNLHFKYLSFHFSEISLWQNNIENFIYDRACKLVDEKFDEEMISLKISSSGAAKTLEHYGRINDLQRFELGLKFLNKRKVSRYGDYINPRFENFKDNFYTENDDYQYVCLDTNAHLLNAYLNIYKNLK